MLCLAHRRLPLCILAVAGLLVFPLVLSSQTLPFKTYTHRDGLPANGVHILVQDRRGYLWIGTGEGLSVYDGYEFVNHHSPGDPSLHYITALHESRSRGMLVGAHGAGLIAFSEEGVTPLGVEELGGKGIQSIVEDSAGNIWCAADGNLYRIGRDDSRARLLHPGGVSRAVLAPGNSIVALAGTRLLRYSASGELLVSLDVPDAVEIACLRSGALCLATRSRELLFISDTTVTHRLALPLDYIWKVHEAQGGDLWIAGSPGVVRLRQRGEHEYSVTQYSAALGLASESVDDVLVDREENVWFGTSGGLQMLTSREVMKVSIPELPLGVFYQPLACDSAGRFWAVTVGGLLELWFEGDGTMKQTFHRQEDITLAHQPIRIQFDRHGRMWLADMQKNIHQVDVIRDRGNSSFRKRRTVAPRVEGHTTTLLSFLVDREGNLWCSLYPFGVVVLDSSFHTIRMLTTADGIPAADIRAFLQDRRGRVWMGGVMGGIAIAEHAQSGLATLNSSDGLPDEKVRFLHEDRSGRIVIGTRTGGLARYDGTTFSSLTISNGLVSDCVWWIDEDDAGRYWLATQGGMQSVDAESFSPDPTHNDITGETAIACVVAGNVVIGYRYGSLVIAGLLQRNRMPAPPSIHITRFMVNGKPFGVNEVRQFPHDENTCILEFTGIKFSDEQRLRYRYRILETGAGWSAPTLDRRLILPGLSPGHYTIQIVAVSTEGLESAQPATASLVILPPPWKTWWAYSLYSLILLAGVVAWRRYEIGRIRARERQDAERSENELKLELEKQQTRMQIARDLHDEVGSTLSSISFFAQALEKEGEEKEGEEKESAGKFLSLISESSAHAKEAMSDIIWSIDPANDSWNTVASKLQRHASELFESKDIVHSIEMPPSDVAVNMDPQRRRHFWLLFKEIVTNVAKHSRCSEVRIKLDVWDGNVDLTVSDNGVGFEAGTVKEGHGLKNIRSRAEMLGAAIELKTSPGGGTSWRVSFDV